MLRLTGLIAALVIGLNACKKDDGAAPTTPYPITRGNIDSILYLQSSETAQQFLPYKNVDSIWISSAETGHSGFFKVRLNAIARSVLGPDGKLAPGKTFPDGSLIVKDLYTDKNGPRMLVAIMKKESLNPYSAQGWLWNELLEGGGDYVSAKQSGAKCVGCHSANDRDFVRVFDLF